MNEENGYGFGGLVFVALMFIGAGVGLLFGRPDAGGALGMGLGFLAMAYLRAKNIRVESEKTITLKSYIGATILALIGLAFISFGTALLLNLSFLYRYVGGLVSIAIGLVFLAAAFQIIKK